MNILKNTIQKKNPLDASTVDTTECCFFLSEIFNFFFSLGKILKKKNKKTVTPDERTLLAYKKEIYYLQNSNNRRQKALTFIRFHRI